MKNYFNQIKKNDKQYPEYKSKISDLKAVYVENGENLLMCTKWPNGEGFDLSFEGSKETIKLSLHDTNIELLLLALKKLKYFNR